MPDKAPDQIDVEKRPDRIAEQADILFEAGLRTFNWTIERSRHFDIKASIFLAFLGILLVPALEIYGWSARLPGLRLAPSIIIIIGTIFCFFAILPTVHHEHPKLAPLMEDFEKHKDPLESKLELIREYKSAADNNESVGRRKVKFILIAQFLSFTAFYVIIFFYLFKGVFYGK